jgi:hypothetical protein
MKTHSVGAFILKTPFLVGKGYPMFFFDSPTKSKRADSRDNSWMWDIMSAMKLRLAQVEARLQNLIEGSAARLFASKQRADDLASRLVSAMSAGIRMIPGEPPLAPNLYTLFVSPNQAQAFEKNQALLESLTETIREAGSEAGFQFSTPPTIRVIQEPSITNGEVRVLAQDSRENLPQTSDMVVEAEEDNPVPENAFLIVNGTRIIPLELPIINIGRRPDNQLVLDDLRVSRIHAQLRVVKGHYLIFDLESSGGTFVNGERIHRATLYPGDVISLAGLPIVYGQDVAGVDETQGFDKPER